AGSAVVPATKQWTQTTNVVQRGDHLQISASGEWSTGPAAASGPTGPAGYAGRTSRSALLPTAPLGALIGKIGPNGQPFLIGARYDGQAGEAGPLFLTINDDLQGYGDNQGRMSVSVRTSAGAAGEQASAPAPRPGATIGSALTGILGRAAVAAAQR